MACCTPERPASGAAERQRVSATEYAEASSVHVTAIPGGTFLMGNDGADAVAGDGEGPVRPVTLAPYKIAATTVTNADFASFVRATRYVTEAEAAGSSFVFFLQMPEQNRTSARQVAGGMPWWLLVEHASWQRPEGPGSHIYTRLYHPVVHVSWHDAQAYCAWSGTRLPSEAEWERAARGGRESCRFPWGDERDRADGTPHSNIWRGDFPHAPASGWVPGTIGAADGEANGFGLVNCCGNVWEWCEDWYHPGYHTLTRSHDPLFTDATGLRSMRGGSFLCHDSYCNRYRLAARHGNSPGSTASNIGFRVARNA